MSKSFFLAEILSVEIDDFCPNLIGAAHIRPQGFIGSLRVRAKLVTVVVVTVGDRRKERGQLLGPNSCLPLLLAMSAL